MKISIKDAMDYGIQIGKEFGVFQRIKSELVRQPDVALKHLIRVLDAVKDTFEAFCKVLNDYLALWFDPATITNHPSLMIEIKTRLRKMKGGSIGRELKEARFNCHQIEEIYDQFLSPYFGKLLSKLSGDYRETQYEIETLFNNLSKGDWTLIEHIGHIEHGLKDAATEILAYLQEGRYEEAMGKIKDDEIKWGDKEEELSKIIEDLGDLKISFRDVTGVIG